MASPLEGLKTSLIVTRLHQLGFVGQFMTGVRPLTPATAFVGKARTLRLLPPVPTWSRECKPTAHAIPTGWQLTRHSRRPGRDRGDGW